MKGLRWAGCGCFAVVLGFLLCPLLLFASPGGVVSSADVGTGGTPPPPDEAIIGPGSWCIVAVRCQQPVAELPYVPSTFYPDDFVSPPGECTSWAAALWPGNHGRGVSWWGDAWQWYANAAAQGYGVSDTPSLGAIIVFGRGGTPATAVGHVGIVIGAHGDGVRITEMNVAGRFIVDERTVWVKDPAIVGYIPVPQDFQP